MSDVFVWPISIDNWVDNMIGGKQGSSEVNLLYNFLRWRWIGIKPKMAFIPTMENV